MTPPLTDLVISPASASRIPIFSPTRRPQHRHVWRVDTSWGWAEITGKLGQQHRDLLDAARMVAERADWTTDGRLHLLVDPAKLRSAMGGDAVNWALLNAWFAELMQSLVKYHVNNPGIDGVGVLLSDVASAKVQESPKTRPGAFSTGRRYLRVSFGLGWSRLLADDRQMLYPLRRVIALRHGFSQAVARYCLGHRTVNDTTTGLMLKVGAVGELRKRRRELRLDADGLLALGILVDGDVVRKVTGSKVPVKTPFSQCDHTDQARLKVAALSGKTITPPPSLPAAQAETRQCLRRQTPNPSQRR